MTKALVPYMLLVTFMCGLGNGQEGKPTVVKKASELNLLKAQAIDKDKQIAQFKFNDAQAAARQVSEDYKVIVGRETDLRKVICTEAGYLDCSYDLQTGVVTEVKPAEKKKEEKK